MTDWMSGPLAGFDLETTGVSVETDRIVTAAVVGLTPAQPTTVWHILADPGIDIPDAAADIHGITTTHARTFGIPAADAVGECAARLYAAWDAGTPVVGFNVCYDLTLLDRELRRHHRTALRVGGPVIDPLVIDRRVDRYRRGSRTLAAMAAHYRVPTVGDAHDAVGDATTAAHLALRLVAEWPEVAALDLDGLMGWQAEGHAAWAANFRAYLIGQGRTDDLPDGAWPLRPWVPVPA